MEIPFLNDHLNAKKYSILLLAITGGSKAKLWFNTIQNNLTVSRFDTNCPFSSTFYPQSFLTTPLLHN